MYRLLLLLLATAAATTTATTTITTITTNTTATNSTTCVHPLMLGGLTTILVEATPLGIIVVLFSTTVVFVGKFWQLLMVSYEYFMFQLFLSCFVDGWPYS